MPSVGIGVERLTPFVPFTAALSLGAAPGEGASCVGAGVECASELFSCDWVCLSKADPSMVGAGDDVPEGEYLFDMKVFSSDDGNVKTTTLV